MDTMSDLLSPLDTPPHRRDQLLPRLPLRIRRPPSPRLRLHPSHRRSPPLHRVAVPVEVSSCVDRCRRSADKGERVPSAGGEDKGDLGWGWIGAGEVVSRCDWICSDRGEVAMGDLSLRKADVEEKRAKVQKESKVLLEYTRKAIAKLNDLKKTFVKFESDVAAREAQMHQWQTNMAIMDSKERQYILQHSNYKALLNRAGYTPEINHGVLMEMAEHRKDLEKKTKPILDTLRSYQDLPPDKALAALAIEDKRRQYAAAEKYLEEVLHSALTTPEL
ncbi:uncharacterized protein A4U43_C05F35060 [Asparagus officinalis]|uniref:AUGMIN subunit 1 n=2 Tax=Asparagus officinalis TaxID=4686 RepID=A0A5P1F1B8_ASPOF|nr:uncharacterized protein A4U43_C05F35060 [Asparagus officinalis]